MHLTIAALIPIAAASMAATEVPDLGPRLERFIYPWPVQMFPLAATPDAAEMAFMDVAPERPNGKTVVLLHGKNFCAATWESTARALLARGYRVIIPDQIGFCKSSKPMSAQYSLEGLADNTRRLLEARGVREAMVVGHSMGGMLAMRYAIMFPASVQRLVLVNPLGLVDRGEEGVPYTDVATLWAGEKKTSYATIKAYQLTNYYHGTWKPAYDRWVQMAAGMYTGAGRDQVALAQAKTSEMIRTQPVAHALGRIQAPTTLIIGSLDRTAFGRAQAPQPLRDRLKPIPAVADAAAGRIPNARVVRFPELGHSPQVEDPARFERTLLAELTRP